MTARQEILWRAHTAFISSAQHYETQRNSVTSLFLIVATALVGLTTYDNQLNRSDIPAALFLIVLGIFGCLFAYKHHERCRIHIERAKAYRDELDRTLSGRPLVKLKAAGETTHDAGVGRWMRKIKVELLWVGLNFTIVVLGAFLLLDIAT